MPDARDVFRTNLRRLMEERRIDQVEIVSALKVSSSTVSDWVSGRKYPRVNRMQQLADFFGVRMSDLTIEHPSPSLASIPGILPIQRKRIPLLGSVAAGEPILATEDYDTYVSCDGDLRCDYALRVEGASMEPRLHEGDVVFVRRQEDVDDGQIAVVLIESDATLKHLYHVPGGILLVADNPTVWQPHTYQGEDCAAIRVLGLAVAYQRRLAK